MGQATFLSARMTRRAWQILASAMVRRTAARAIPAKGQEFSAVAGPTYNLENLSTNYQNGVDFHLDWAASQFLSKQVFVGPVGYVYDQLSCDSGSGDRVGCFESRVVGIACAGCRSRKSPS